MGEEEGHPARLLLVPVGEGITELLRRARQLVQVLGPGPRPLLPLTFVVLDERAALHREAHLLSGVEATALFLEVVDERNKVSERAGRAGAEPTGFPQMPGRVPQRGLPIPRRAAQRVHGARADPAGRGVDHPLEGRVVVAVGDEAEIRERILDFGALVEAQAAVDPVGQAGREQGLFQYPGLRAHPVQYRDVGAPHAALDAVLRARDHEAGFIGFIERRVERDRLSRVAGRPQLLAETFPVVGDERVSGGEDGARRAVVLLQPEHRDIRKVPGELVEMPRPRAAPTVDGLVVVAHRAHQPLGAREQSEPGVLDGVGILELVDEKVREAPAVVREDVVAVAQQLVGAQEQLGKIDDSVAPAHLFVGPVDRDETFHFPVAAPLDVTRAQALVLARVDEALDASRRPALLVEVEIAQHAANAAQLIFAVEDLKARGQAGFFRVGAQQAIGETVKGAHPHAPGRAAEHVLDAGAHLACRLVGEGDDVDAPLCRLAGREQPGDAMHEHPGLAASRAREHELVAGWGGDGVALGLVQGVENVSQVHSVASSVVG